MSESYIYLCVEEKVFYGRLIAEINNIGGG